MVALGPRVQAALRFTGCSLLLVGVLLSVFFVLAALIGPIDVDEFDPPEYPELLRKEFGYLRSIWSTCIPLGYSIRNHECDVFVGEADCQGFGSRDALATALRAELKAQENALWVAEGDNWLTIVWPGYGGERNAGKLLLEDVLVMEGTMLRLSSGEIMCKHSFVDRRAGCLTAELKRNLRIEPPIPVGLRCSSDDDAP